MFDALSLFDLLRRELRDVHMISYEKTRVSPERLLPFSQSHLLFSVTLGPLPVEGLGVEGLSSQFPFEALGPSGLGEP